MSEHIELPNCECGNIFDVELYDSSMGEKYSQAYCKSCGRSIYVWGDYLDLYNFVLEIIGNK